MAMQQIAGDAGQHGFAANPYGLGMGPGPGMQQGPPMGGQGGMQRR